MRKSSILGVAAAAVLCAQAASAATLLSATPGGSTTLTFQSLAGTEDLTNNAAPFANGGPLFRPPFDAYLFDEGTGDDGFGSLLLHYDRKGGLASIGTVFGAFVLQLGVGETYLGSVDKALGLLATDPLNGVKYQTSFANLGQTTATLLRGTEFPDSYSTSFNAGLNQLTVNYSFTNDGAAQDQVRFFFQQAAAVPEPATWAMMIAGFGLAGAMLRRRGAVAA